MLIDAASWDKVSALFDQVATLTPTQRAQKLAALELDAATSTWLQKLLAAHDSSDTQILDQTLNQIAADLIGADAADAGEIPAQLNGQMLGHWRIRELIARGAMATVFHGERADGAYEQHVAIKLLQPGPFRHGDSEQLREELRLLARLEHIGIARLIDGGISDQGWPYLVMEYVDGVQIDQWCSEQKLDWRQRLQLMLKVCAAVRYAHSKLVVHADIKPSNVLVNRYGEVKLVDFGIAGLLRGSTDPAPSPTGIVLRCSPAYAAPEQLRGEPVSTSNDVFGLGALLYELLTDCRIRDGKTVTALLLGRSQTEQIIAPCRQANSKLPGGSSGKDLNAICLQALAQDPQQRYASVSELQQDVQNLLQHYPISTRGQQRGYVLGCWMRRHAVGAASVLAIVLSLAIGLVVSIHQTQIATQNARRAAAVQQFLLGVFDASEPGNYESTLLVPHRDLADRAAAQLDVMLTDQPQARIDLQIALARMMRQLGFTDRARPLLQAALNELGSDDRHSEDPRLVAAWFELGQVELVDEFPVAAVAALQQADQLAQQLTDPPVAHAAILFQLGEALRTLRRPEQALQALEQARLLARQNDGSLALMPRIRLLEALTLNNLGEVESSLRAGEQAVLDARRIFGNEHNRTASALSTVGGMLRRNGRLDDAERLLREAYAIGERSYGFPSPAPTNNLADLLETRGQLAEAEALRRLALELAKAQWGEDKAVTARYIRNLALTLAWQQHWDEALDYLDSAVRIHSMDASPDHHHTVFMRTQRTMVRLQAGHIAAVREELPHLLEQISALRDACPHCALLIHNLAARFALAADSPDQALVHAQAIERIIDEHGTQSSMANSEQVELALVVGDAYVAAGETALAAQKWAEAQAMAQQLIGPEHPLSLEAASRNIGQHARYVSSHP